MKDRIPTHPGRVKLLPVPGEANTYDMQRADEPMEEGTPLNKATLLSDMTAGMLRLKATGNPTVDDAFVAVMNLAEIGDGLIRITGHPGIGITGLPDGVVFIPESGAALVLVPNGAYSIAPLSYLDIDVTLSKTEVDARAGVVDDVVVSYTERPVSFTMTSSTIAIFSPLVVAVKDVSATGGGGGGAGGSSGGGGDAWCGGGGGGASGCVSAGRIQITPNVEYPIVVGAAGSGGNGGPQFSSPTETARGGASGGTGGDSSAFGVASLGGFGGSIYGAGGSGRSGGGNGGNEKWLGNNYQYKNGGSGGNPNGTHGVAGAGGEGGAYNSTHYAGYPGNVGTTPGGGGDGGGAGTGVNVTLYSGGAGGQGGAGQVTFTIVRG